METLTLGSSICGSNGPRSLRYLLEQRVVHHDYQRWLSKLLGYDFEIQYRPGLENKAADAFSRIPKQGELLSLMGPMVKELHTVGAQVEANSQLARIKHDLEVGSDLWPKYSLHQGNLLYQGRLVLPYSSSLINAIMHEYHTGLVGGHSGFLRTYKRIMQEFYWIGMRGDIQKFVAECEVCQMNKTLTLSPAGALQPLPVPKLIWEDLTMDFIEGLPRSNGFNSIFVVVDRLSKYAHFIPLKHPYTTVTVAAVFAKEVVRLHGVPRSIISDRDKVFLSHFWTELFRLQGTSLRRSTAYHPQIDGQSEVVNRCLETYLRCFSYDKPNSWNQWLSWAEYWYNTSFHVSIATTPFRAVYGRDPPPLLRYEGRTTPNSLVEQQLQDRDAILLELKFHLNRAQAQMKKRID